MSQYMRVVPSRSNSSHGLSDGNESRPAPGSYEVLMPSKTPGDFLLEILALAVGGALGVLLGKLIERWLDGDSTVWE